MAPAKGDPAPSRAESVLLRVLSDREFDQVSMAGDVLLHSLPSKEYLCHLTTGQSRQQLRFSSCAFLVQNAAAVLLPVSVPAVPGLYQERHATPLVQEAWQAQDGVRAPCSGRS